MSQSPQDAWFFTREGEKIGPVTLADLRIKAHDNELHPRLDMVWCQGMSEWKPAGEIDGLFEKRNASGPKEELAPPSDPYTPPEEESVEEKMSKEGDWPGARRRSFIIMACIFPAVWGWVLPIGVGFLSEPLGPEIANHILLGGTFLPVLTGIYFYLMRLVNLGMSRWWILANFVPLLNFWIGFRTFACPAGYAYHKKLDGAGIFLAIIYWLLLLLVIVSCIAFAALFFGAVADPEIRRQIQEGLRMISERTVKP